MRTLLSRAAALFRRDRLDRRLDEEVRAHLDLLAADYERRGMTSEQARFAARCAFGGVQPMKEEYRDARGMAALQDTWRDVVYAVRALARAPVFTATVVVTLALGIGANTAVFTLIDAIAWRTLPARDPESLLLLTRIRVGEVETGFTYPQAAALGEQVRGAELAAYSSAEFPVVLTAGTGGTPGLPERLDAVPPGLPERLDAVPPGLPERLDAVPPEPPLNGQLVSGNYFALLGVGPQLGRVIGPADDVVPGGHPVAVISDGYWSRRFARDPGVIGRTLSLSGTPFTIVGVTPKEFFGVEVGLAPDVYLPIMMQATAMPVVGDLLVKPTLYRTWLQIVARLDPGVPGERVAAALAPVYRQHLVQLPPAAAGRAGSDLQRARAGYEDRLVFAPAATGVSALRQQFARSLFILFAIVGVVLLIGCANTANLLLARAAARRPELALRLALGAGRSRLFRQLLVEGLVLASIGGAGGYVLAEAITRMLIAYASTGRTPIALNLTADWRIFAFTGLLSILTALIFALVPALRAARVDLASAVRQASGGRGTSRLHPGRVLVVAQVALSLLLLVTAGLFVRTLINVTTADHEAPREQVLVVRVEPRGSNQRGGPRSDISQRLHRTYTELIERLTAVPGVRSVSMGNVSPARPESGAGSRVIAGGTVRADDPATIDQPIASSQVIYPGYFATLGIALSGRDFTAADLAESAAPVCIVNVAFARMAYPGENALGRPCTAVGPPDARRSYTIVGIAQDSRYAKVRERPGPVLYTPFMHANTGRGQMILYVRVDGDTRAVAGRVREEVWRADGTVPQYEVRTLAQEVDAVVIQERLLATVSTFFGALALILTAIGLHGLLAFLVVQRKRELAIRMALGAERGRVIAVVARETLLLVAAGAAIAVPAAWMLGRLSSTWLEGILFGLSPTDGLTIVSAIVALAAVGLLAASIPARRAAAVDPMVVLRSE